MSKWTKEDEKAYQANKKEFLFTEREAIIDFGLTTYKDLNPTNINVKWDCWKMGTNYYVKGSEFDEQVKDHREFKDDMRAMFESYLDMFLTDYGVSYIEFSTFPEQGPRIFIVSPHFRAVSAGHK